MNRWQRDLAEGAAMKHLERLTMAEASHREPLPAPQQTVKRASCDECGREDAGNQCPRCELGWML